MNRDDEVTFNNKEMSLLSFVIELQRLSQRGLARFGDKPITWAYLYYPTYPKDGYEDFAVLVIRVQNPPSDRRPHDSITSRVLVWAQSLIKNYITVNDETK